MADTDNPGSSRNAFRIAIANEPFAYRDVLCFTLRMLRPDVVIHDPEPEDLVAIVDRYAPHLVICSRESLIPPSLERAWLVINQNGNARAILAMKSSRAEVDNVDFEGLMALISRAENAMLTPG